MATVDTTVLVRVIIATTDFGFADKQQTGRSNPARFVYSATARARGSSTLRICCARISTATVEFSLLAVEKVTERRIERQFPLPQQFAAGPVAHPQASNNPEGYLKP